jgi:hypothetical protein
MDVCQSSVMPLAINFSNVAFILPLRLGLSSVADDSTKSPVIPQIPANSNTVSCQNVDSFPFPKLSNLETLEQNAEKIGMTEFVIPVFVWFVSKNENEDRK